jgi:hypothetical protein
MGLNTWAAFRGLTRTRWSPATSQCSNRAQCRNQALRSNGINIVAIHHHMTDVKPVVIFLHYYGTGPVSKLAQGVRAAVDVLGKTSPGRQGDNYSVFLTNLQSGARANHQLSQHRH